MSCSIHADLANAPRTRVAVNGVVIPRDAIAREAQNHPAQSPVAAWQEAARALVIRELLLQEAGRLEVTAAPETDAEGRCETHEEAKIRALFAQEAQTPEPDEETCNRYYQQNRGRFRSPDIYEAAHILIAARRNDAEAYDRARNTAQTLLSILEAEPSRFAELAEEHSDCPSSQSGGNLGQITAGQTTPEFEKALLALDAGTMAPAPVETRYGVHILRLDRRIAGGELPFHLVREKIARHLATRVRLVAAAQYVARLAAGAKIEGIELPAPASLRVN
jgi:peptidyl-prolyl cis-trans isomerase C